MKKIFVFILAGVLMLAGCSVAGQTDRAGELPQVFITLSGGSFIDSNGDLYTWGYDQRNVGTGTYFPGSSLGQGTEIVFNNVPTKIYSDVAYVQLGNRALTKSGEIIEWSTKYENDDCVPHVVRENVAKMYLTLYLTNDGELYTMPEGESKLSTIAYEDCGELVMTDVKDFMVGHGYFALKNDGSVWTFMVNSMTGEVAEQPQKVIDGVARMVTGLSVPSGVLFLKNDGTLWSYGGNEYGQCGNGEHGDLDTQTYDCVVTEPYHLADNVIDIWASTSTTFYLTEDHELYACGRNYNDLLLTGGNGQMLSSGYPEYVDTPTPVMSDVKQIDYGGSGLLVLKTDNTLWSWGYADLGILGNGESYTGTDVSIADIYMRLNTGDAQVSQPTKIMDHIKRLFSGMGGLHFAEKKDGSIWYWGYGTLYQIGDTIEPIGLKGTGVIETLYYIIPTPIEFSVDTFYQTALEYAQIQTITEE
ncbi:MAG TPA: hypothetical protein PK629_03420 [Oscillospiraceae bacterium]|nr:hypothetical protein [Oscillospiraceae bacterium]HPK34738.1 hypothetical protein [Oscillospiraceae bacterium]HPR76070.1 hypothetical protein [Oscillospiraceae bacterium]